MVLSLIVAVSDNHAIGKHNGLPWHLPEDLKFFKKMTSGKPIIMGRKTFDSLGKALPNRLNIVLSRQEPAPELEGTTVFKTLDQAIDWLYDKDTEEAFIIGGGQIFEMAMNKCDQMYVTKVHTTIENADAFFPSIDHTHWKLVSEEQHESDAKHEFSFSFQKYERIEL